jgi:hypothetical protein
MIWLLAHPLTPVTRQQVVSLSQSSCVSLVELTDGKGGGRVGEEPNHRIARMPGPLCNIQYSLSRRMIGQTRDFAGGRVLGKG